MIKMYNEEKRGEIVACVAPVIPNGEESAIAYRPLHDNSAKTSILERRGIITKELFPLTT